MHYVIGDVHGCYDELMNLLNRIDADDSDAKFCFLGDFPDRGPKIRETLDWMLANITEDGKYQSIRGNHEQNIIDWATDEHRDSCEDYAIFCKEIFNGDGRKIQEITDFFDKLPYNKLLTITLKNGNVVPYRICHAAHKPGVTEKESHDINLWERDYWGRCDPNELTVCGHTPTFDRDFNLRGADEDMPGFICYRNKMINDIVNPSPGSVSV